MLPIPATVKPTTSIGRAEQSRKTSLEVVFMQQSYSNPPYLIFQAAYFGGNVKRGWTLRRSVYGGFRQPPAAG